MAVQADKRPPETVVKTQRIYDFSGGLNTTINGSLLNTNEAQIAKNVAFEQKGTLVPLRGRRKRYSSPFVVSAISGMGMLYKQDGTSRIIIASGTGLYSDKPNLSKKWDSKADFEQIGTQRTKFIDLETHNGSIELKHNYFSRAMADCSSVDVFNAIDATIEVDLTTKAYNASSLKMTIPEDKTTGKIRIVPIFEVSSPMCFAVKVANKDLATGLKIASLKLDGTEIKASAYYTNTGWSTLFIKLNTEELGYLAYLTVDITGTVGQYGNVDGLVFYQISQTDYDNVDYVPLDFTNFEPLNATISVNTLADFNEGALIDCINDNGEIRCAIGNNQSDVIDLIGTGDKTNIDTTQSGITVDTKLTWVPYKAMTFDDLIAL